MEHSYQYQNIDREIVLSCDTFGGYKVNIDVALFSTKQDLINSVINSLLTRLTELNLTALFNKLTNTRHLYHIHDFDMGEILLVPRTYYICNHNCDDNTSTSSL